MADYRQIINTTHERTNMSSDEMFEYFKEELRDMKQLQIGLIEDVAGLKVKSGVWGFAAGLIPAVGVIIVTLLNARI